MQTCHIREPFLILRRKSLCLEILLHVKYGKAEQYPCVPTVCKENVLVGKRNLRCQNLTHNLLKRD